MNKAILLIFVAFASSCGSVGVQSLNLITKIPQQQKEMEERDNRIKKCLHDTPPTCSANWDQAKGAWVIKYIEPKLPLIDQVTATK